MAMAIMKIINKTHIFLDQYLILCTYQDVHQTAEDKNVIVLEHYSNSHNSQHWLSTY